MSFDTIASLQRMEQMQQAEAASGNRLVLRQSNSKLDITILTIGIVLIIPTATITFWLMAIYFAIKNSFTKTILVKNVATGEKFRVTKTDFKQYKKDMKNKEREVRSINPNTNTEATSSSQSISEPNNVVTLPPQNITTASV
ncbi:hypothetical protein 7F23_31 [uncultured Caudovirales phage]|uniref:Uncharacterized protein n=1 Tax=uncultured Caudovirales phage TaxID=2100421 RepID=A0A2H4J241_9CAUD|nr:hypothetical protein 7F23_31 [uncultured Caudovirales phage]